jgi:transcriptional regulator with XRE-family HTH domain
MIAKTKLLKTTTPVAVKNLRRIWESKKSDMKFTQVTAAQELGWSQGLISHYLNNITDLGPMATIKFANFLGVDPRDIDPQITDDLPKTTGHHFRYIANDMDKVISKKIDVLYPEDSFMVELTADTMVNGVALAQMFTGTLAARVAPLKSYPKAKWVAFTPKGTKVLRITPKSSYKPLKTHTKVFGVVLFAFI